MNRPPVNSIITLTDGTTALVTDVPDFDHDLLIVQPDGSNDLRCVNTFQVAEVLA